MKEKILEIAEIKKELDEEKKMKDNLVLVQIPYGVQNHTFLVSALISKDSFNQMKLYDDFLKKELEKLKEEEKPNEKRELD